MEKKKLYIISFGDSRKYRLPESMTGVDPGTIVARIENNLNGYLRKEFADDNFQYFTSPKIEDVDEKDSARYNSYPVFDKTALRDIEKVLRTEVMDMNSLKEMNSDAPFSNV